MTRVTLAVAASRGDSGFPEDLEAVTEGFGGRVPASPYDGSAVAYDRYDDGKNFSVTVPEVRANETTLPEVAFHSAPPAGVE